jgi:hypothetical protein
VKRLLLLTALLCFALTGVAEAHHRPNHKPQPPPPPPACADGLDNDGDGYVDLADIGCTSSTDTAEFNAVEPPPPPPPGDGVPVPSTINATCSTDVTSALQSFVANQPNGTTVVFPTNGCYRVEGTLSWTKTGITLQGNGSVIRATTVNNSHRAHIKFVGGGGWTCTNLDVQGVNPSPGVHNVTNQYQHGFAFEGTQGATLDDCDVSNPYGDGFYVGKHPSTGVVASDVSIKNADVPNPGRNCVAIVAGLRTLVQGGSCRMAGLNAYNIEPNQGGVVDGATFDGITLGPWPTRQWQFTVPTGPPDSVCPKQISVKNVAIRNVRAAGSPLTIYSDAIECSGQSPIRVANLTIENNSSDTTLATAGIPAIIAKHVDGLRVAGHYQAVTSAPGVSVCGSTAVSVLGNGNVFPGASTELSQSASC